MSYVIDVYRGENSNGEGEDIVKYSDIDNQIYKRKTDLSKTSYGIKRFIYGLSKKVLIANIVVRVADEVFGLSGQTLNMPTAWIGIICYSLQIYFDFSGYSDMAIGLGNMFGFKFTANFNYPSAYLL